MSRSGGIGQLFKGVVIGVVLLLAIIGTMSILDKGKELSEKKQNPAAETVNIPAPSINVAAQKDPNKDVKADEEKPTEAFKPTLEEEKTVEATPSSTEQKPEQQKKQEPQAIQYGMLELGAIHPETKEKLKADYVIYDANDVVVAESKNSEGASYRLPTGQYKVVTTLSKSADTTRKVEPVQTTKTITIAADKTSNQIFKLEPATTIGVLQVSAKNANTGQVIKASFVVQKENGETVATRQNVSASLFKLKAGSYRVTVRSGNNSDFRTVVVEPGESTQEEFKLQEAYKLGRVLVRIFDIKTNRPIPADIVIATSNGTTIQELKAVSQTEISLPAANYKIRVTGPNGQSSKRITVSAGKSISEIFRFDAPDDVLEAIPSETPDSNGVQITDNVKITAPKETSTENASSTTAIQSANSILQLFAKDGKDNQPIKSNFYVQTTNGKHIAKKIYSNSAEFELKPGTYRITVRSKNRSNIVQTIRIEGGQKISHSFTLRNPNSTANTPAPVLAPPKPAPVKNTAIPNGFLNVSMNPPKKTHFIVATKRGKKIVELTSVPSGKFKLDTGQYVVTAIHNNIRRQKNINIRKNQTSRLVFQARDFQKKQANNSTQSSYKGVLRSRIVNRTGQALRGDLTVTNRHGQVVARANAVTVGLFDLTPGVYNIIVNYRGLRGSERVNIVARETTVQTFTIAPNSAPPNQGQQNNPSLKDKLREKIEREIRKQF